MGSDDVVLLPAAQGSQGAFAALYDRHYPTVFAFVCRRTHGTVWAEDITAQTFAQALQAFPRYQERGAPFVAWLLRIAANEVVDQRRRDRRIEPWPTDLLSSERTETAAITEATWVAGYEQAEWLRTHLSALSTVQRRALWLRFGEERSVREVAVQLGRSEGATKMLLHRTIKALRDRMQTEAV
jgi:RNA polymerase sigma-70 factor, ECF subfamily